MDWINRIHAGVHAETRALEFVHPVSLESYCDMYENQLSSNSHLVINT